MKPLWIVQNNLGSTGNFETMRNYAYGTNIPFLGVKIRPFTDDVPEDNTDGPVVIYGACGMVRAARKTRLARGIFDNPEGFYLPTWKKYYGNHLLNHDAMIFHLDFFIEDSAFGDEKFFVRSNNDEKTIIGHITDWKTFRTDIVNRNLPADLEVVVSKPRAIYREYRCFIVDGQVISASSYGGDGNKLDNFHYSSDFTLEDAKKFAGEMIKLYQPHFIFVMDVCDSEDGPRIVELNGFNSSGFYNTDIPKIMDAVNDSLYFKKNSS